MRSHVQALNQLSEQFKNAPASKTWPPLLQHTLQTPASTEDKAAKDNGMIGTNHNCI